MDAWSERAAEYAALQANLLKDLQSQKVKEANEYGRDYWNINQKEDSQLTSILNLGLDDDDEDDVVSPRHNTQQQQQQQAPMTQQRATTATVVATTSTKSTTSVVHAPAPTNNSLVGVSGSVSTGSVSAADLEARLLAMPSSSPSKTVPPPPVPGTGNNVGGPVPRLVSLTTMQPVPIPADWNPSLPPPPGTLVIYDQPKGHPTVPSQGIPPQSTTVVPSSSATAANSNQFSSSAMGPTVNSTNTVVPPPQGNFPPNAMMPMSLRTNGGPLPPNMVMMLQTQLQHAQTLVQNTPGGMNGLPPQMRMQITWMQQMLQSNQVMMQHRMQMMQAQQQQLFQQQQQQQQQAQQSAKAPAVPATVAPSPAPVPAKTGGNGSSTVKSGISYSKILAPDRSAVPASSSASNEATVEPVKRTNDNDMIVSVGPIVKNDAASSTNNSTQPNRILSRPTANNGNGSINPPLPPGMAPPLPMTPPPSKPVTLMSVLSSPVPNKLFGNRMSKPEVIAVTRLMFNQLATADPFSEAYYHFALATKASAARAQETKRLQALAMGIQLNTVSTNQGNVFDAAAVLTSMGTSAIAGGRGKELNKSSSNDENGSSSGINRTSTDPSSGGSVNPPRTGTGDNQNATVDLLAALPTQSMYARNMAANLDDLKKLHAIKRRLWETHNHVLGRQESASIRAPKRTLNLSESGITTGNDLREHKSETNVISSNHNGTDDQATVSVPTWTARARIDSAHDSILSLQDAARTLQGYLRLNPPPPSNIIDQARSNVSLHRLSLASALGLKAGAPVPPSIDPNDEPEIQAVAVKAAQAAMIAAENIHGINAIDDNVILSILSLPKGKRLFARAGPMLSVNDRTTLGIAGMRHLPYFVASTGGGKDAETADSTLSQTLATWIRTWMNNTTTNNLGMLNVWITELQQKHNGSVIRALLQHPGASDVISALLTRGEGEANTMGNPSDGTVLSEEGKESIQMWRTVTDALGRAFVESA